MPKDPIPYSSPDISALAKTLRNAFVSRGQPPSHVELLNILARAAGRRNFQHLRAEAAGSANRSRANPVAERAVEPVVVKASQFFDADGHLRAWPAKTSLQTLCLWVVWARIPPRRRFDERSISRHLDTLHHFGDAALLRRTLWALGLLWRTKDGGEYRRIELEPSPEGRALIRHVLARSRPRSPL